MLTDDQIKYFNEQGYLVLPEVFTMSEVDALIAEARTVAKSDSPQRIMEKDGELVRAVYGVHLLSPTFELLTRDERTVGPARKLLHNDVYIHQTQLNPKAPFRGDVWEWHQDFLYWARDDGMPEPRVLSVAVLLDDVTEFNGPIFVINGSHSLDLESQTSTYADTWVDAAQGFRHRVENDILARIMEERGLFSIRADRGSVVVFDGRLLHCSPPNLSSSMRTILFIRYNAIDNALRPVPEPRPDWVASRNPHVVKSINGSFLNASSLAE